MPDSTTKIAAVILAIVVVGLLVAQRIITTPDRPDITLVEEFYDKPPYGSYDGSCPQAQVPSQLATCGSFARYTVGDAEVAIEHGTVLVDGGDHLRFDIGRVLVTGDVTLTTRDVKVTTHGTVSVVHFSWLNTMNVKVINGTAAVDQGGEFFSTVNEGNAVTVDTLTPYDPIAPTEFNIDASSVKAFYDWALGR